MIELTQFAIAAPGVVAGWARWLEIEAPTENGRWPGGIWPPCLVVARLLIIGRREA